MFEFDGKIMYVDPVSDYADYTKLPKADVILITHEHGDHLDPKAISVVEKEGTILIANANSQKKLGKGVVMKNGDRLHPRVGLRWMQFRLTTRHPVGRFITRKIGITVMS